MDQPFGYWHLESCHHQTLGEFPVEAYFRGHMAEPVFIFNCPITVWMQCSYSSNEFISPLRKWKYRSASSPLYALRRRLGPLYFIRDKWSCDGVAWYIYHWYIYTHRDFDQSKEEANFTASLIRSLPRKGSSRKARRFIEPICRCTETFQLEPSSSSFPRSLSSTSSLEKVSLTEAKRIARWILSEADALLKGCTRRFIFPHLRVHFFVPPLLPFFLLPVPHLSISSRDQYSCWTMVAWQSQAEIEKDNRK